MCQFSDVISQDIKSGEAAFPLANFQFGYGNRLKSLKH